MQARGTAQKAYVEQCKGGAAPAAAAPEPRPTAAAPTGPAPAPQTNAFPSQKTAKNCIAEWRADKAGMQARGTTEKAYVEQCKAGDTTPIATAAPALKPTAAAPAPAPSKPTPTAAEAAPAAAPHRPASTTTAAPAPAQPPPASKGGPTLEAGQSADEASAKARCPTDTMVWVNLPPKIYHFAGTKSCGTTKCGAYMCEKEAMAGENRAAKAEKHFVNLAQRTWLRALRMPLLIVLVTSTVAGASWAAAETVDAKYYGKPAEASSKPREALVLLARMFV